jgi:hypothetical protein
LRHCCDNCRALSEAKRDVNFTDNDFHNIGVLIARHAVVGLAQRAPQLLALRDRGNRWCRFRPIVFS